MSDTLIAAPIDPATLLRHNGLRVTAARVAVLNEVQIMPHASADQLLERVQSNLGTLSRQAMYDVLHALSDAGILRAVQLDGRSILYEMQKGDNHHHLVCRDCGKIIDVPCAVGAAPCLTPSSEHDFDLDEAEVIYRGVCPDCKA